MTQLLNNHKVHLEMTYREIKYAQKIYKQELNRIKKEKKLKKREKYEDNFISPR